MYESNTAFGCLRRPAVPPPSAARLWGQLFGSLLREAREERGRSVEEAAEAAGMRAAEWEAVEAGQVPETWEKARRMADGLGIDRMWIAPAGPVLPGGLGTVTLRGPGPCRGSGLPYS